jgi:hypothetical protein
MKRRYPDEGEVIERYHRFRTCPACCGDRMVYAVNADAVRCPDRMCGFVLTGKEDRAGAEAILDAVAAHRARLTPGAPTTTVERLESIERRLLRLEEAFAYEGDDT